MGPHCFSLTELCLKIPKLKTTGVEKGVSPPGSLLLPSTFSVLLNPWSCPSLSAESGSLPLLPSLLSAPLSSWSCPSLGAESGPGRAAACLLPVKHIVLHPGQLMLAESLSQRIYQ